MPFQEFAELPAHIGRMVPLLARGAGNHAIAEELFLAVDTVEHYGSELKARVGARDRVGLVLRCREYLDQNTQSAG